ncbi:claudin-8-like [Hyla sarda]|uniref:claudin-8-like n=1 Tax=Hyla sarda TaxID=327740 RepID=UPI0024C3A3E6|nr:claudin-8-like [Hyla sarda]
MSWFLVQIIGIIFGGVGMILTWVITIMPQWRVSILAENNGINGRIDGYWISRWDGLWTTCVNQARLPMQCNSYESQVSLTMDLKSGRILMSFAILMTFFAFVFSILGFLMHKCHDEGRMTRQCMRLTAGLLYIFSTILIAIPIIWTSSNILTKAYDASVCRGAMRIEMGEALFLAWPAMAFILIAGIILCCQCSGKQPCMSEEDKGDYRQPHHQEMVIMRSVPDDRPICNPRSQYI